MLQDGALKYVAERFKFKFNSKMLLSHSDKNPFDGVEMHINSKLMKESAQTCG